MKNLEITRRHFFKSSSMAAVLSALGLSFSDKQQKVEYAGLINNEGKLISNAYSIDLKNNNYAYQNDSEIMNARGGQKNLNDRLELIEKGIFNVLRYPYNQYANDNEAIQAAINDANKAGGGIVLLPSKPDPYRIIYNIKLADNVSLMGQGTNSVLDTRGVTIKVNGAIGEQLGAIWARSANNIKISNIRCEGDGLSTLIALEGCSQVRINECYLIQDSILNVNESAIGIYDNPEFNENTKSYDIQILNNIIRPSCISIIIQGRQKFEIHRVHIIGNQIDGRNINSPMIFPAGIKVDKNVHQSIVGFNSIDGAGNIYDGINIQEIINNSTIIGNLINNTTRVGVLVEAGQSNGNVENITICNNNIFTVGQFPGTVCGIRISRNNAKIFKNINISNNIIQNVIGEGIMDNSGDIQNFKISENLINDVNSSGIYIKSNNASIFNNLINGSYNIESIKVGPNTHNVKIISNDLNQSRDGETIVIEPHSDAIIHNNFIKGKFYSVYSKTIVNKWIFKGNWIIELILNNLNFDPYNSTKIDTGINLLEYSSIYKGIFQCYGTITGIDSNNINHCAMFNTNMLISENFHPIGQRGKFIDADDLDLFHSISIDVYMDNIQLIVTNNHPTLHLNNVMIYCTITKNSLS